MIPKECIYTVCIWLLTLSLHSNIGVLSQGNATFSINKYPTGNVVKTGNSISYVLTASFPLLTSSTLTIEIFTAKDNATGAPVTLVCNPKVTSVGAALQGVSLDELNRQWQFDSLSGATWYDHAWLFLNNITQKGAAVASGNSDLTITFSALVTNAPQLQGGVPFVDSFGFYVFEQQRIWVGQSSYSWTASTAASSWGQNVVTLAPKSGSNAVQIGTYAVYTVSLLIQQMMAATYLEVFAANNLATEVPLHVEDIRMADGQGDSYDCVRRWTSFTVIKTKPIPGTTKSANVYIKFDLGTIFNEVRGNDSVSNSAMDTLNLEMRLLMTTSSTNAVNYPLLVGVMLNNAEVFLESVSVQAVTTNQLSDFSSVGPDIYLYSYNPSAFANGYMAAYLNLTLPPDTEQYFTAEFYFSESTTSPVTIDRIRVIHVGGNFPADMSLTNSSVTKNSTASNGLTNYAKVDFGLLSNLGPKTDDWSRTIVVEVSVFCVDLANGLDQDIVKLVAAVTYASNYWIDRLNVTLIRNASNMAARPNIYMYWPKGYNVTYPGSSMLAILDVEVPLQTSVLPFTVTFYTIYDNKPIMSVCSVDLVNIGEYLLGINQTGISVFMSSSNNDYSNDMASISFQRLVSNVGRWNYTWEGVRHFIRFEVKFVLNSFLLTSMDKLLLNTNYYVALMGYLNNGSIFLGGLTFNYSNATNQMAIGQAPTIIVASTSVSAGSTLAPGELYVANYTISTSLRSVWSMYVEVTSEDMSMRVCSISRSNVGSCLACLPDFSETGFVTDPILGPYQAYADWGNVANLAYDRNNIADNSFTASVIAMRTAGAPSISNVALTTKINVGPNVNTYSIAANVKGTSTPNLPSGAGQSDIQVVAQVRNGSQNLIIGAFNLITMDLTTSRSVSVNAIKVTFTVPSDASDQNVRFYVCAPYVLTAGSNLPCVNDKWATRTTSYNSPNDISSTATVTLDLGMVPNLKRTGNTEIDVIRIEFPVMPLNTTNDESTGKIGYSVRNGNDIVASGDINVTMIKDIPTPQFTPTIVITPAMNNTPVPIPIYSNITYRVNFTLAESMHYFNIRAVSFDTSKSAILAFHAASFTYIGYNYPCWNQQVPRLSRNSSDATTATDSMYLEGILSHVGRSRRDQFRRHQREDDIVTFQFSVVLMDRDDLVNGSLLNYSITFSFGNTLYEQYNMSIQVFISGNERPRLATHGFTNNYVPSDTHPGDTILLSAVVNHTELSTRMATNIIFTYYLPAVIQYGGVASWSPFPGTLTFGSNALIINIPKLIYTDNFTMSLNVTLDPQKVMDPQLANVTIVIPQYVAYSMPKSATIFSTGPIAFGVKFNVSAAQTSLGMASGDIQNCQLSATSNAKTYSAQFSRPTSVSGWAAGIRGAPFSGSEYLQINFGNLTSVEAVTIYFGNDNGTRQELVSFSMSATTCGTIYRDVLDPATFLPKIFTANLTRVKSDFVRLSPIVQARAIRIIPKSKNPTSTLFMFRLELWGSALSSDVSKADVCTINRVHPDYYTRGYLVDTDFNRIWVCISIDNENGSRCSGSFDGGQTWFIMPDLVHCVTMLHLRDRQLWGIGSNRYSRVRSDDNGVNWVVTTEDEYDSVANLPARLMRRVTLVSWDDLSQLTNQQLKDAYGFSLSMSNRYYSVNSSGIVYFDGNALNQIAYWGTEPWN